MTPKLQHRIAMFGAAVVDPASGDYTAAAKLGETWAAVVDAVTSGKQSRAAAARLDVGTVQVWVRQSSKWAGATEIRELYGLQRVLLINGPAMQDDARRHHIYNCKTGG